MCAWLIHHVLWDFFPPPLAPFSAGALRSRWQSGIWLEQAASKEIQMRSLLMISRLFCVELVRNYYLDSEFSVWPICFMAHLHTYLLLGRERFVGGLLSISTRSLKTSDLLSLKLSKSCDEIFSVNFLCGITNQCSGGVEKNPQDILITAVINWLLLNVYALMIFHITQVPFTPIESRREQRRCNK